MSTSGAHVNNSVFEWSIYYGEYDGVERFAVKELHRIISENNPDCITVKKVPADPDLLTGHSIILGTRHNNCLIAELVEKKVIEVPAQPEGYAIYSDQSFWDKEKRLIVIAGADENGVLYGVQDFAARVLAPLMPDYATPELLRNTLDSISNIRISDYPKIAQRGIWTWGYKIYDYRRFLDNMARLKLNLITTWNLVVPVNIEEFIDYAHSRGIRVVLGFHWGWGVEEIPITSAEGREKIRRTVVDNFKYNYARVNFDAIYFQTQTEHFSTTEGGRTTASYAVELVNEVSSELLEINPDLEIHFGLHASSIQDNYTDLKDLREDVIIVWEDAGVLPYYHEPVTEFAENPWKQSGIDIGNPEGTIAYSKKIASFRVNRPFGMVAKGWTKLDWPNFKGHDSYIIGEYSGNYVREKRRARDIMWNQVNTVWCKHYPLAARFYKELLPLCESGMIVQALIEDGVFEESIEISAALFGVTVWDPTIDIDTIFSNAMSLYYVG